MEKFLLMSVLSFASMNSFAGCVTENAPEVTIQELAYMEKNELENLVCLSMDYHERNDSAYRGSKLIGSKDSEKYHERASTCLRENKNAKRVLAKDHNFKISDEEWVNHCGKLKK